jgi:hypothetical protein
MYTLACIGCVRYYAGLESTNDVTRAQLLLFYFSFSFLKKFFYFADGFLRLNRGTLAG